LLKTIAIELKINTENIYGNGLYEIYINNELWLQSGQLNGYFNNKWYTSNKTLSENSNDFGLLNMVSIDNEYNLNDEFNGKYNAINIK